MGAEYGSRFQQKRTQLQDVIPLDTPMVLMMDASSVCNQNCPVCPNGRHNQANWNSHKIPSFLSYEMFRKVIDETKGFPNKIKRVRLYKEGEPLLNKRLPDMIRYVKMKDAAEKVDFTSNGTLLGPDINLALIDAGLDRINISFYGTSDEGWEVNSGGTRIDFSKLMKNLEHLYKHKGDLHIFVKIMEPFLGEWTFEDFKRNIGGMCDEISLEYPTNGFPYFHSTDNPVNIYGIEGDPHEVCTFIFYMMVLNSDGTYSACDVDWNRDVILGDARTQNIVDVWNSKAYYDLHVAHLTLDKSPYYACSHCGELIYAQVDNIDCHREDILRRYQDVKGRMV